MANKTSKPQGNGRKPAGPMAVNKSDAPLWTKTVIIVIILVFVVGGIAVVWAGGSGGGSTLGNGTTTSTAGGSAASQAKVDSALSVLQGRPGDAGALANVGHAYFEWAVELYEAGQYGASIPIWQTAVDYYDQSLAVQPGDDIVLGNKSFALFYAYDAGAPIESAVLVDALQAFIDAAADNAQLAPQVENARGMLDELQAAASAPTTTTP